MKTILMIFAVVMFMLVHPGMTETAIACPGGQVLGGGYYTQAFAAPQVAYNVQPTCQAQAYTAPVTAYYANPQPLLQSYTAYYSQPVNAYYRAAVRQPFFNGHHHHNRANFRADFRAAPVRGGYVAPVVAGGGDININARRVRINNR